MVSYKEVVEKLYAVHINALEKLAQDAFDKFIKPFCDRHGLWLVQKMNDFAGSKILSKPGGVSTNENWDDYLDDPRYRDVCPEMAPPEGYAELREGVFFDLPGGGDTGWSLLWFMPEYKPKVKRG